MPLYKDNKDKELIHKCNFLFHDRVENTETPIYSESPLYVGCGFLGLFPKKEHYWRRTIK